MSETVNAPQEEVMSFDMHTVFNKKPEQEGMNVNDQASSKGGKNQPLSLNKANKTVKDDRVKEAPKQNVEDEESAPIDNFEKEEPKPKELDYKSEYEKQLKINKDTQKSFHEDRKKLAAYKKAVEKMKEDGALLDEEATALLDHTKYENVPEEEPLYLKYGRIWDKEIEYMKKYAPNPEQINQHILAFQHFMQAASPHEIHEVLSDLSQYEENEVEFTKQMLEIGRQYNEEIYSDIHEAGSIRKLKSKYSEKEEQMQKKIDKLEKQLHKYKEKYEDFDTQPANYNLPTGSKGDNIPEASFDIATIFNKPYQR